MYSVSVYFRCCACMKTSLEIRNDNCCLCHTASIRKTAGVHEDDIIHASFHNKVGLPEIVTCVILKLSSFMTATNNGQIFFILT